MQKIPLADVHIRLLRPQDIPLLGKLYVPWSTEAETVIKWTRYEQEQQQKMRFSYLATIQDEILGYVHLIPSSSYPYFQKQGIPEINELLVYERYRNQGIACLLIQHLEQIAKQQQYQCIGIGFGLYQDYGPAQRLYIKLGYQPDGQGITYQGMPVVPGQSYSVDDELILWLLKNL